MIFGNAKSYLQRYLQKSNNTSDLDSKYIE